MNRWLVILEACTHLVRLARSNGANAKMDFNEVEIAASPESSAADLAQAYHDECEARYQRWINSDEYKRRQEEAALEQAKREALFADLISRSPTAMTLSNPEGWQKSLDAYGRGVLDYAERWARLIEGRMAEGARLDECADRMSHVADTDGITGFQYGCAVSILSQVWAHGPALKQWHQARLRGS